MMPFAFVLTPTIPGHSVVLTYHDVIERRDAQSLWFDCSVEELENQLDWLKRQGARFVTLDELRDHLTGKSRLPAKSVAITFADNYEGFYLRAWPILQRRKIPVAMFVHTGYVGDRHGRPKMSWGQLRELDRSGLVTVASQTINHPHDITKLDDQTLRREFVGSKDALERHLGHSVRYLAYPNGKCNQRTAQAAKRAGYDLAFSESLAVAEQGPSLWLIPRYVHTKFRQAWRVANGRAAAREQ